MRKLADWFSGKVEDDRQRTQKLEDSNKSLRKRFTSLQQILKGFEKTREHSSEDSYNLKEDEFYRNHASEVADICTDCLRQLNPSKGRTRLWEEVFVCLDILIDMARYGSYTSRSQYSIELTKACLLEENRRELRERGFKLLLNLLNFAPKEPHLKGLLLINLYPFVIDTYANKLPDCSVLQAQTDMQFIILTNASLTRFKPFSQPYVVPELSEFDSSNASPAKTPCISSVLPCPMLRRTASLQAIQVESTTSDGGLMRFCGLCSASCTPRWPLTLP
jgi:hypothetical protein